MARLKTKKTEIPETRAGFLSELAASLNPAAGAPRKHAGLPTRSAIIVLMALLLVLFLPFARRAFHIDDPMFIWSAKQIQNSPGNPYGFAVNWYGYGMP